MQGQTDNTANDFVAESGRFFSSAIKQALFAASIILPIIALVIWLEALKGANPNNITDLGLITALPLAAFWPLILLIFSFCLAISAKRPSVFVLLLHTLVLIFMLYGVAILVEGSPRTATAWKLVGIMDHVMRFGSVIPERDAFQNWPGFYFLMAFLTAAAGIESPLIIAAWAHVIFNVLFLGPLIYLMRSTTLDVRLIWLSIWFFYLNNWIGQDYLAPQAFGCLLYFVMLGILLNRFQGDTSLRDIWTDFKQRFRILPAKLISTFDNSPILKRDVGRQVHTGAELVWLMALIVLLIIVLVPSHQLTPVALLVSVTALVLFGRIVTRSLPFLIGVLIVAWLGYMASPFLRGHVEIFSEPFGAVTANIGDNLTERVRGSQAHMLVVILRIFMTLGIFLLATLGFIRRLRNGSSDVSFAILAIAPFSLLVFQTYGGELLMRSYLFALPFIAFFIAALFLSRPSDWLSWVRIASIFFISVFLALTFLVSRYGNERMDYFRPTEIEAVNYVYSISEPGSQMLAATDFLPWRFKEYNTYKYLAIARIVRENDISSVETLMSNEQYPDSYLILTRSQKASGELLLGWEPGTWERFEASLLASGNFELVFENADAKVYVFRPK